MTGWSRVSVVTVARNSTAVIGDCLRAIGPEAEIIIVDNASDDDLPRVVKTAAPGARIERLAVNRGFGRGVNAGLALAKREFALVINPDAVLSSGAIDALVEAADFWPDAAMLAPRIRNPDGSIEASHDVGLHQRRSYGDRTGEIHPDGPICADFLSGAAFMLRMAAYAELGGFDPAFFLYYEDDDICARYRAAGRSLVLVPQAEALHLGGRSSRPSAALQFFKYRHMAWSRLHYERKWQSNAVAQALALRESLRYGAKAVGNLIKGERAKSWRDLGRLTGSLQFLAGLPSQRD